MVQINWTIQAKKDLKQIRDYISKDSISYAENQIKKIYHSVQLLQILPLLGSVLKEKNEKTIRELIEGNYKIIYQITATTKIDILTIHHCSRQFNPCKL